MSISILIVAHNEEKYIKKCLDSIKNQTRKPDEVLLIAHNCSDNTVDISKQYPFVKTIEYSGPEGTIYARIRGFELVTGDVIACIDGDSYASPTWLEHITEPFSNDNSIVGIGGFVRFNGFFANLASLGFFFFDPIFRPTYHFYFWGANFAVRKSEYEKTGGFTPLITLKEKLGLHLMPDDAYLSCALMKLGKIIFVYNAQVYSDSNFFTQSNAIKGMGKKQNIDRLLLFRYFNLIK